MRFRDREQAGELLADRLAGVELPDPVLLALPRGGLPVTLPIAVRLGAPVDVAVVRKLGAPRQPELAVGAAAEGGILVLEHTLIDRLQIGEDLLDAMRARAAAEIELRRSAVACYLTPTALSGRTAIIVDDGAATGMTALAACRAAAQSGAAEIVVAVPVASRQAIRVLAADAKVIAVEIPHYFDAVGHWYDDFRQLSDADFAEYLRRARDLRAQ